MPSPILKVGFEIEGGWNGEKGVSPFPDLELVADHSINGQTLQGAPIYATHVGEAVSPPLGYATEDWKLWLLNHWPNADPPNRSNPTCGFHIHVSVESMKDYTLLTSKLFLAALREVMLSTGKRLKIPPKHEFWKRMDGKNTFCTLNFDASPQIELKQKGGGIHRVRYGWLNFSWGVHGTMEFRALPTFRDAAVAVEFSSSYFEFIEAWLAEHRETKLVREFTF